MDTGATALICLAIVLGPIAHAAMYGPQAAFFSEPDARPKDCTLVRERVVWRLEEGRAVLVGYRVFRRGSVEARIPGVPSPSLHQLSPHAHQRAGALLQWSRPFIYRLLLGMFGSRSSSACWTN